MSTAIDNRPPGKVQAIGYMHLIAGILNLLWAAGLSIYGLLMGIATLGFGLFICCPVFIVIPVGIMEIVSGAKHLSSNHSGLKAPRVTAILEICSVLTCSMVSTIVGILTLVFISDPEVDQYYQRKAYE
jgi:hypothetical protein